MVDEKTNKSVFIETLGCAKNVVDSERIAFLLKSKGFEIVKDPRNADYIMVNTCGFIEQAKQESIDYILSYAKLKEELNILRKNNPQKLVVFGCLAERYKDEIKKEIPEIDLISGVRDYLKTIALITQESDNSLDNKAQEYKDIIFSEKNYQRLVSKDKSYAYLKISEGCNHICSFCAIPTIRGKLRSRTIESLVEEAKFLSDQGVKEIIIVSQDTTNYGIDIYKRPMISELLYQISKIEDIKWIRLHYLYPTEVNDELIEAISSIEKVCKYIDMPLQHASDRILKSMKRGGNREKYEEIIYKIRERIPEVAIRTTFIVGYPGESYKDFLELKDFVDRMEFSWVGVFEYSHEEGTDAYVLEDNISKISKSKRRISILKTQFKNTTKFLRSLVGKVRKVIIDEVLDDRNYIARTEYSSPEVDGYVHLVSSRKLNIADIVDCHLIKTTGYDMYGKYI